VAKIWQKTPGVTRLNEKTVVTHRFRGANFENGNLGLGCSVKGVEIKGLNAKRIIGREE